MPGKRLADEQELAGGPLDTAGRPPVLTIQGLSVTYGDVDVVRNVDLTIRPGQILGLIGESGSGKSSVAMSCLGLLGQGASSSAKRLDVCGTDVRSATARQLSQVRGRQAAMVFQDAMGALDPSMRVGAQVAEVVRRHRGLGRRESRAAVLELLAQAGIPEPERRARQYPHQMSGGLRQRSAIALALAGGPRLLFADEPTTALDVTVQAGILALFRQIRDDLDMGILLISHDLGVIAQTADQVAVMRSGEIVEHGTVHDVLSHPQHSYTQSLLRAVPTLESPREQGGTSAAGSSPVSDGQPPGAGRPVVLSARGVSRSYGSGRRTVQALRPTDVDVTAGEVLGIVGESGSGKSTLAKLLVHLERPSTGQLTQNNVAYSQVRGRARRSFRRATQMVFQHPAGSLDPRLRISSSVREPLTAAGVDSKRANVRVGEVLREVGLGPEHGTRLPHELSGGQKQRVAIARAIAGEPSVVVLDEPTSALDVSAQAQVLELLAELHQHRNTALVFISHNLAVVRTISDRVAVMYAGRIVEVARTDDLFGTPAHWYTVELLAAVPSAVPPAAADTAGDPSAPPVLAPPVPAPPRPADEGSRNPAGCAFAPRCPRADTLCWDTPPALAEIRSGHHSACHHPFETAHRELT
jgi:peptide/nickel transport system ATP-binding protein